MLLRNPFPRQDAAVALESVSASSRLRVLVRNRRRAPSFRPRQTAVGLGQDKQTPVPSASPSFFVSAAQPDMLVGYAQLSAAVREVLAIAGGVKERKAGGRAPFALPRLHGTGKSTRLPRPSLVLMMPGAC